jgi:hypothetical protein
MRPLFTIDSGENSASLYIQERLKLIAWIPTKQHTGSDLLVSDRNSRRFVSLQIKYGRDYLPEKSAKVQTNLRCLSWFTLNWEKLNESPADFWVFVLHSFKTQKPDFVVVPTSELRRRLKGIHGSTNRILHSYLCSTETNSCWEARAKGHDRMLDQIADGVYKNPARDFTKYLNGRGWTAVTETMRAERRE